MQMPALVSREFQSARQMVGKAQDAWPGGVMRGVLIAAILCLLVPALSQAADYDMLVDYATERVNHARETAPLPVDGAFGDELSLYQGTVTFNNTDISVPGNSQLPVELRRTFAVQDRRETTSLPATGLLGGFGDWNLDIPNLHGSFAASTGWQVEGGNPNSRCSAPSIPVYSIGSFNAYEYWDGYSLHVPGSGDQELLVNNVAQTPKPTDGAVYPWVTKEFWVVSCKATTANGYAGESFVATSPDGTRYTFDWVVTKAGTGLRKGNGGLSRVTVYFLVTRVEDRFGNWVTYTYSGDNLTKIEANDGRKITLTYSGGNISSVISDVGTWAYDYASGRLTSVLRPDGSTWIYSRTGVLRINTEVENPGSGNGLPDLSCRAGLIDGAFTYAITNPSKATATFTFGARRHVRTHVPNTCSTTSFGSYLVIPIYFDVLSLVQKTVAGVGLPTLIWSYSYAGPGYQYVASSTGTFCGTATCATTKSTTVTGPDSTYEKYTYGIKYKSNEGQLIGKASGSSAAAILETLANTYVANEELSNYSFPSEAGTTLGSSLRDSFSAASIRPLKLAQTDVNGDTFTSTTAAFDNFARPLSVTRANSAGETRTDATAYYDDLSRWVLGQVQSKTNINTGQVESSTTYYAATALPEKTYAFGLLQRTLTFNADGTLASLKDGLNRTTTLSNWKRGVAQSVSFPGGASKSAVMNNSGTVASITDERANTTAYGYDTLGRLASVAFPTQAWSAESITRQFVSGELGMPVNTWRVRAQIGTHQISVYHDALFRPVLTEDKDTASGITRYVRRNFDHDGRTTFESYRSGSFAEASGINSTYDALGRLRKRQTTDGIVLEQIDYLSGNRRQLTDADGKVTTITSQAFDAPSGGPAIRIEAPENQTTTISRDVFGKITSITQAGNWSGGYSSASRSFAYDSYQRLCRRTDPESGSTLWGYDAASQITWELKGQSGSGCVTTQPSGATVFGYDARGRKTLDDYPGTADDVSYGYDAAEIGRAVQQECRDRSRMPSSA
eukprot:TRINITY_DN16131_c2_g1_i3.p1 TRINITY_DN16131_c2_g1~~TRINITY_DN16131_c2_g1_i3.p1  ORF type:complete len:1017 (-),score=179.54 TRINITY_DN16131_c2_g1_i3:31-3081(-)